MKPVLRYSNCMCRDRECTTEAAAAAELCQLPPAEPEHVPIMLGTWEHAAPPGAGPSMPGKGGGDGNGTRHGNYQLWQHYCKSCWIREVSLSQVQPIGSPGDTASNVIAGSCAVLPCLRLCPSHTPERGQRYECHGGETTGQPP